MSKQWLVQLLVFVAILVALNFFFALHISILGSVALTVIFTLVFSGFGRGK